MFSNKEYGPDDYVFTDENGNKYISTPEYNVVPDLILICIITFSMPLILGLTFYLSLN